MPTTKIIFYQESPNNVPVVDWLERLQKSDPQAAYKCFARIKQLQMFGHELRRPVADYLRDGIWELRIRRGKNQYRILYFFHGQNIAILSHALIKKANAVPVRDIDKAIQRKEQFCSQPTIHTYKGEIMTNIANIPDALEIVDRLIGDDERAQAAVSEEYVKCEIAKLVYETRTKANLTKSSQLSEFTSERTMTPEQLATLIGVEVAAIVDLEDADYEGSAWSILQKIAIAFERHIQIDLVPNS